MEPVLAQLQWAPGAVEPVEQVLPPLPGAGVTLGGCSIMTVCYKIIA